MMKNQFKIREANRNDAKSVLYFIKELAIYEKMLDHVTLTEEEIIKNIFEEKYANALILEESEKEIGFAVYYFTYSTFSGKPTLYLEDLFIKENYRGKGYGKQALSYLARLALKKDCSRFEWSCLKWNKPSIAVYEKINAKALHEWVQFRLDGEDLISLANEYNKN